MSTKKKEAELIEVASNSIAAGIELPILSEDLVRCIMR